LLRHGLVHGSFIPDRPQREQVRYRLSQVEQRSQVVNRIQKVLEEGNIKLGSVATNVVGSSGRAMLEALIEGTEDPKVLVALARGKLQEKRSALEEALEGLMGRHQRLLLASHLGHLDFLDQEVKRMEEEVGARLSPFQEALERLDEIPGVGQRTRKELVAEMGMDMSRFPTAAHLASWAKLCPGNNESGGIRKSAPTGQGNKWLRATLMEAAKGAGRTKDTYLSAQ